MRRIMTHVGRGLIMVLAISRRRCIRAAGPMVLAAPAVPDRIFKGGQTDRDRIFRDVPIGQVWISRGARIVHMAPDLIFRAGQTDLDLIFKGGQMDRDLIFKGARIVRTGQGLISMAGRIDRIDRIFGQTAGIGEIIGIVATAATGRGILTAAGQTTVGIAAGTAISEQSEKLL